MKRIKKSAQEPSQLTAYKSAHPVGTSGHDWDVMCKAISTTKRVIQAQIRRDQRGLCAYCEIDMLQPKTNAADGRGPKADFQVEHFHEKNDKSPANRPNPACDWGLWWPNLYGCCMGGAEKVLVDPTRSAASKNGQHCGAKKLGKSLSTVILDPHQIPAFPCLFTTVVPPGQTEQLELVPNVAKCSAVGPGIAQKAQASIDSLNLNCVILSKRRRGAIHKVFSLVQERMKSVASFDAALEQIIAELYDPQAPTWPPFFSSIRAYFGVVVENHLRKINYDG